MIWQLLKRDSRWQAAPSFALALAASYPWTIRHQEIIPSGCMGLVLLYLGLIGRRATRLEAGLPIAGRDLVAARILATLAVLWLPILAFAGVTLAATGALSAGPLPLIALIATLCSLTALWALNLKIQEIEAPRGPTLTGMMFPVAGWFVVDLRSSPAFLICLAALLAGVVVLDVLANGEPVWVVSFAASMVWIGWAARSLPCAVFGAICVFLATALFWRIWRATPRSFQLAPASSGGGVKAPGLSVTRAGAGQGAASSRAWLPVAGSVWSWQYLIWLPFLCIEATTAVGIFGVVFMAFMWLIVRTRTRWLATLPINRSVLLAAFVAPAVLVQIGGYLVGPIEPYPPPRAPFQVQVIEIASLAAATLILTLLCALFDWRRMPRVWFRVRNRWFMGLLLFGFWVGFMKFGITGLLGFTEMLRRFALSLPNGLDAAGLGAAALVLLWLAADKVNREPEYADRPRAARGGIFSGGSA